MANHPAQRRELTPQEIEHVFKQIEPTERLYNPNIPMVPEDKPASEKWIVIGGSSKQNNRLMDVSAWQIGQQF